MESTGRPGKVHLSESTYQFLKEDYYVEEGEEFLGKTYCSWLKVIKTNFLGMKTYFITGLKNSSNQLLKPPTLDGMEEDQEKQMNNNSLHEPISQNGTKSLPSLGNDILLGLNIEDYLEKNMKESFIFSTE